MLPKIRRKNEVKICSLFGFWNQQIEQTFENIDKIVWFRTLQNLLKI